MPRKSVDPIEALAESDVPTADLEAAVTEIENESGVNPPPYTASWITIKDAANLAGVTGQSVRNAYETHEAFNTVGAIDASGVAQTTPHWFHTKMIDNYGNTTAYPVVYVDRAAVERWIEARAGKPSTHRSPDTAKRYIVRLSDAQLAQQPTIALGDSSTLPAVALVDGMLIAIEKPPQARRKVNQPEATNTNGQADEPMLEGVAQSTDLFDVDLVEN